MANNYLQKINGGRIINASVLKYIAMLTMFMDHAAVCLILQIPAMQLKYMNLYLLLRGAGRMAFPIYCFLLVEGYIHTSDIKKYIARLAVYAVISEIPFDLMAGQSVFDLKTQNVMWSLLISLIMLWLINNQPAQKAKNILDNKTFSYKIYKLRIWFADTYTGQSIYRFVIVALAGLVAYIIRCDYGWFGPIFVSILYLFRFRVMEQTIWCCAMLYWEPLGMLALIPIRMYNGLKGNIHINKYLIYAYYPIHILMLVIIRNIIRGF